MCLDMPAISCPATWSLIPHQLSSTKADSLTSTLSPHTRQARAATSQAREDHSLARRSCGDGPEGDDRIRLALLRDSLLSTSSSAFIAVSTLRNPSVCDAGSRMESCKIQTTACQTSPLPPFLRHATVARPACIARQERFKKACQSTRCNKQSEVSRKLAAQAARGM